MIDGYVQEGDWIITDEGEIHQIMWIAESDHHDMWTIYGLDDGTEIVPAHVSFDKIDIHNIRDILERSPI